MNGFIGVAMLVFAGVLYLKYRPKFQNSRVLWVMTALMGVMSFSSGPKNWVVALIQLALQIVVAACCLIQLKREQKIRRRRAIPRHAHRPSRQVPQKIETCA